MKRLVELLLVALIVNASNFCYGYTYFQVGVDSNFLIDGNRVIFAQADGSLTVVALDTGTVIKRIRGQNFSGGLKLVDSGIMVLRYSEILRLDPTNFAVVWKTSFSYEPNVLSNVMVSYDGNGAVESRTLIDGKVRWKYELPGALTVVAEGRKVLIYRAATYDDQVAPTAVLLDLDSGKELFRKVPPSGVHWSELFFDGQNIFATQGTFVGKRSNYKLENIVVWDVAGELVRSIPMTSKMQEDFRSTSVFEVDGKVFYRGRVYSNRWEISNERFGNALPLENGTNADAGVAYDLKDGYVLTERTGGGASPRHRTVEIELRSPRGNWSGELPYLSDRGRISGMTRAGERILIGSDLGHVECIDAATGKSLWLYVFPTIRHTISYSSPRGMPPMLSTAAAIYRKENSVHPTSGLKLLNQEAQPTRIILDPDPANPFKRLPGLLAITWGGAGACLICLVIFHLHPRTVHWNLGLITLLLLFPSFGCFMEFGRVSPGSSIALRFAVVAGLVLGSIDAVRFICRKRWIAGILLLIIFLAFGFFAVPIMIVAW